MNFPILIVISDMYSYVCCSVDAIVLTRTQALFQGKEFLQYFIVKIGNDASHLSFIPWRLRVTNQAYLNQMVDAETRRLERSAKQARTSQQPTTLTTPPHLLLTSPETVYKHPSNQPHQAYAALSLFGSSPSHRFEFVHSTLSHQAFSKSSGVFVKGGATV
jgi:hypothetical protein